MLLYKHIKSLFDSSRGIEDETLPFQTVFIDPNVKVLKGLYIPILANTAEGKTAKECLSEAITNGAVAAIWLKDHPLPHFVPNHFPVFFVQEPLSALKSLVDFYVEKASVSKSEGHTKFDLSLTDNHNERNCTYDSPVIPILKELENKLSRSDLKQKEGGNSHA